MDVDMDSSNDQNDSAGEGSSTPRAAVESDVKEEDASEAQQEQSEQEVEVDGDADPEEYTHDAADGIVEGQEPVTPRPRGRGRGRPRGSGAGRSRGPGRPRGSRGRGRGRGRALTIRLPKKADEDGGDGEADTEAGYDAQDTPAAEGEEAGEKVAPLGGGKPFRRINGRVYIIDGDEYVTDDDPKGDAKVDQNGNLLGGRRFKAQTFILPNRHPERQYMLAIDAARTSGFRDSLYYFRRNPLTFKLNATQPEKDYLIEQGKLGSHLRTRSVTLITARSAYKLHGAKMLIDGRWVVDDYYEDKALEEITAKGLRPGDLVGELQEAQPESKDVPAVSSERLGKSERSGAGPSMYRPGGPTTIFGGSGWGPFSEGPLNAVKKSMLSRDGVTEENFMLVAAQRTAEASAEWAKLRRNTLLPCGGILGEIGGGEEEGEDARRKRRKVEEELPLGVYEPHSGIVLYRTDTQPTRSRWSPVPDADEGTTVLGGTKTGNGAWALAWVDTVMELPTEEAESGPPIQSIDLT
ncbi:hypothetical protein OE88DRAFT_1711867 [Heliocybe sulcata]|uniref:Chromatin remodelling complex Rsc7/Swp82 subunit n=1 Tax=Heliocybe sulcata TaxID=5364 RepID=A0A5C3N6Y2_9AGAM|nr:hypothetical protein OE88DRAFT_1711867 [Heliocybe sulcata]